MWLGLPEVTQGQRWEQMSPGSLSNALWPFFQWTFKGRKQLADLNRISWSNSYSVGSISGPHFENLNCRNLFIIKQNHMNTKYVPGTVLAAWYMPVKKSETNSYHFESHIPFKGERTLTINIFLKKSKSFGMLARNKLKWKSMRKDKCKAGGEWFFNSRARPSERLRCEQRFEGVVGVKSCPSVSEGKAL